MLDILEDKRSEITEDTLEFYADLIKKCWNLNPENRYTVDNLMSRPNQNVNEKI